ncbi:MAG: YgiT-type zinc finger protein [candidate division KSB1 bacterium]
MKSSIKKSRSVVHSQTCEFCEGAIDLRHARVPFHFKGTTIYVDNVPAWSCKKCGARYFDAPVYKRLEEIARQSQTIRTAITFPLADYAEAGI